MTLNEIFKAQGEFTHEQNIQFFVNPTEDTLNLIIETDDEVFRKACLLSYIDFNGSKLDKKFCNTPVIRETLIEILNETADQFRSGL